MQCNSFDKFQGCNACKFDEPAFSYGTPCYFLSLISPKASITEAVSGISCLYERLNGLTRNLMPSIYKRIVS